MKGPFSSIDAAAKEFTKKFSDKTKNKWENRDKFVPAPGKYTLIEMDDDPEGEEVQRLRKCLRVPKNLIFVGQRPT